LLSLSDSYTPEVCVGGRLYTLRCQELLAIQDKGVIAHSTYAWIPMTWKPKHCANQRR